MPTADQVTAIAPDAASLKAARDLASPRKWQVLGGDEVALWGLATGSGKQPYQTRVALADLAAKCSCPSRKFPCKHSLGLMLIGLQFVCPDIVVVRRMVSVIPTASTAPFAKSPIGTVRAESKASPGLPRLPPSRRPPEETLAQAPAKGARAPVAPVSPRQSPGRPDTEGGGARSPLGTDQLKIPVRQLPGSARPPAPLSVMHALADHGLLMVGRDMPDIWQRVAKLDQGQRAATNLTERHKQSGWLGIPGDGACNDPMNTIDPQD